MINYFEYKCETCFNDMKRLRFDEFYCLNCYEGVEKIE